MQTFPFMRGSLIYPDLTDDEMFVVRVAKEVRSTSYVGDMKGVLEPWSMGHDYRCDCA